jgi:hypothetical protein
MEAKMLSKHKNENVNNTTARSGGTSPSTKWLKLVLLPNYSNEGIAYAFLDIVFNKFHVLTKVFTNQSMKFSGEL